MAESMQMIRRQCRPIPGDGTTAPPPSADPNGPGAAWRRRGKNDEYGQTNPEDGGPVNACCSNGIISAIMERIVAGRRRVREYNEAHGLSEPSDEGLPPRRVHTSEGILRIIDILHEGRERSRLRSLRDEKDHSAG